MHSVLPFSSEIRRFARRHLGAFVISLITCAGGLALYVAAYMSGHPSPLLQFLTSIELQTVDARFRLRGPIRPDPNIVIVAIDEKSEDVLGRWPFSRSAFAKAVDFLWQAHAAVVSFDVNFPQPDQNSALQALQDLRKAYGTVQERNRGFEAHLNQLAAEADDDAEFSQALSRFQNAILGYQFYFSSLEIKTQDRAVVSTFLNYLSFQSYPQIEHGEYGALFSCTYCEAIGLSPNLPRLAEKAKNFGFFNVVPDPDGPVRREPVIIRFQKSYYPSLDIATVLAYRNYSLDQVAIIFNHNGLERIDLGREIVPTDPDGYVQINFHGPARSYPWYSLSDVALGRIPPSVFQNRIVLIGATASGIGDMAATPFQKMAFPGVEVHANTIDNLLHGDLIRRGPREDLLDLAVIVLFTLPVGVLLSAVSPLEATLVLCSALGLFLWLSYDFFAVHSVWIAVFLPLAALFVNYGAIVSYRYFFEEREKKQVRNVFQHYVAPGVIKQMLDRPDLLQLGGKEQELTAMFTDIRGFTSLSEKLSPHRLVELLNDYFTAMTEIIFKHRGTLDKYIGDAIMAFWGAPYPQPEHAELACRTGIEMIHAVKELQVRWQQQGLPYIDIGIGINTGSMLVGNVGSLRRFNFTIMGDNVNQAQRLESLNKAFGTGLIISHATYQYVQGKFPTRELDFLRVKGKAQPVMVYQVFTSDNGLLSRPDLLDIFQFGLRAYRAGQWNEALASFGHVMREFPEDGPSQLFVDRCWELLQDPPEEWDGVFVMKGK